jgi:uncharacterized cupin superfamily protein
MHTSAFKTDERVEAVYFTRDCLVVGLLDTRTISVPLSWYPKLLKATQKERAHWVICGGGYGIHWPDLDEDLSTEGLLRGALAPSVVKLKRPIKKSIPRLDPHNILHTNHTQLSSKNKEPYSKSAVLSELFGFQDLFVHHEILEPGKRASAPHRHTLREEMVFVLEGNPTAQVGDQTLQLKPGDFIGFPPSFEALHFIENRTGKECRFLVI